MFPLVALSQKPPQNPCRTIAVLRSFCYSRGVNEMKSWKVTLKTAPHTWSTITVEAPNHLVAAREAQRLLGNHPVSEIV